MESLPERNRATGAVEYEFLRTKEPSLPEPAARQLVRRRRTKRQFLQFTLGSIHFKKEASMRITRHLFAIAVPLAGGPEHSVVPLPDRQARVSRPWS